MAACGFQASSLFWKWQELRAALQWVLLLWVVAGCCTLSRGSSMGKAQKLPETKGWDPFGRTNYYNLFHLSSLYLLFGE